ncbi:ABC transporter permease [Phycisphaerales bacterium ac7]|nr:ABC transporter permease [bacterium]
MALTDFAIIRRSMFGRMFSTVTTVLTVAVAVALMLTLLSLRDSGRQAFERGTGNMDFLISRDPSALVSVLNGVYYANPPQQVIPWAKYEQIANNPRYFFFDADGDASNDVEVPPGYAIPIAVGDTYRSLPVVGTTSEYFRLFHPTVDGPFQVAEGELFDADFEVVVGSRAAEITGLKIGDRIALTHGTGEGAHLHTEYPFEVVGILEPTASPHDRALFITLESSWIIHAHDRRIALGGAEDDLATAEDVSDDDRLITGIYAKVATRPGRGVSAAMQSVQNQIRSDTSINVAQPAAEVTRLFSIVSNIDQVFLGMAAVVMLSSGIAIMLAMYNSAEQRRRQIAILRVLGCSRPRIFGLVMTESAIIGLIGAAVGIGVSTVATDVVAGVMRERLGVIVTPSVGAQWMLSIIMATVFLACIAGLVPSIMAYRTPVARNLRPVG